MCRGALLFVFVRCDDCLLCLMVVLCVALFISCCSMSVVDCCGLLLLDWLLLIAGVCRCFMLCGVMCCLV